jgi:hypothetical protein
MTSSGLSFEMLPVLVNSAPTWSQMTRPSGAKRVSRAPVTSRPCAIVKFPAVSTAQAFQLVKAIRRVVAGLRLLAEAGKKVALAFAGSTQTMCTLLVPLSAT